MPPTLWFVRNRKSAAAAFAIVLVSINLRPAIVALGPVLDQIRSDYTLSHTMAGVLVTIPVLCFGIFSPLAGLIAARLGFEATLGCVLAGIFAGSTLRLIPAPWALFSGTTICGIAIAIGNVVVPALIKRDFAHRIGLMTGLYSMAVSAGSALIAALTIPVQEAFGLGWRPTIATWAVLAVVAAIAWAPHIRAAHAPAARVGSRPNPWRSPLAWWVAAFFGFQSLGFYATQGWLPELLMARGYSNLEAGLMLGIANVAGVLTSFAMPLWAARRQQVPGIVLGVATGVPWLLLAFTHLDLLAVIVIGLSQGAGIALAMLVISTRSPDVSHAAELSAMSQGAGYILAALGPFAVGALHDATGSYTPAIFALAATAVAVGVAAYKAGTPRFYATPCPPPAATK